MTFKDLLNEYLKEFNCNSKKISELTNISPSVISRYRSGQRRPEINSIQTDKIINAIFELGNNKYKKEDIKNNLIDYNFHITPNEDDLYSMVRLDDINYYKDTLNLKRVKILSQDGPTDYLRKIINKMDEETFEIYYKYHLSICEREELLGASSHVLDILKK